MKNYVEKVDRWKTAKVLEFLGNFLKNHSGSVQNGEVFKPITDRLEDYDWGKKIKTVFSEKTVARMENFRSRRSQLDFTDDAEDLERWLDGEDGDDGDGNDGDSLPDDNISQYSSGEDDASDSE